MSNYPNNGHSNPQSGNNEAEVVGYTPSEDYNPNLATHNYSAHNHQIPPQASESAQRIEEMQDEIDRLQRQVDRAKEKEDDDDDAGCFVEILLTVVVAIALWIFCPSDQKMTTEISREVADEAIQYVGRLMDIDQYIDPNADHLDDEEVVRFAKKYGSIDIKNYGVVKLGYFTLKGKKKEHLAGIGICGFVITKSIADKL